MLSIWIKINVLNDIKIIWNIQLVWSIDVSYKKRSLFNTQHKDIDY